MPRTEQGNFHDLQVTDDLEVHGSVAGTIVIHPGSRLIVRGDYAGLLHVKADAQAVLLGEVSGEVIWNDGLIRAAGVIDWEFERIPGQVIVCAGSLLTGCAMGAFVLQSDGTPGPPPENGNLEIVDDDENYCLYVGAEGGFAPVGEALRAAQEPPPER